MDALYKALPHFGRLVMLALMVWREVRHEAAEVKLAVAYVAVTRAEKPGKDWWGDDILSVLFTPLQFTSLTYKADPQLTWFPREGTVWNECMTAAADALFHLKPNPVPGAVFYFSPPVTAPPKDWGAVTFLKKLGPISFYK